MVHIRNLRAVFSGEVVLDDVTFEVARGEFVCLLGPSGCGKSTTLRIIGGLLPAFQGNVLVDSQPPSEAWGRLAYVFQTPRLAHWCTALGNITLALDLRCPGMTLQEKRGRALRYLEMVGLANDIHKYPAVLSGGERQRVSIARALAVDPEVILMDEPLSDLDVHTKEQLRDQIVNIWQGTGKTIIFVTHDLDEALQMGDRVIVFSKKPTRILRVLEVREPRPRNLASGELSAKRATLRSLFTGSHETDGDGS